MKLLRQKRLYLDDCTVSQWRMGSFMCLGLELPWRNNQRGISCIPEGLYKCEMYMSPSRHMIVPQFINVDSRSHIQIHPGNYTSQIQGCQLPGDAIKDINNDGILDVSNSLSTFQKLMAVIGDDVEFMVEVFS